MRTMSRVVLAIVAGWLCSASHLHAKMLTGAGASPHEPVLLVSSIAVKINALSRHSRVSEPALLLLIGTTLILTAGKLPLIFRARKHSKKLQMQEGRKDQRATHGNTPFSRDARQFRERLRPPQQEQGRFSVNRF